MNAGVALVQAYLQINGYFTSADFPVIQGRRGGGEVERDDFMEVTDIDILAVRLPLAAHVVARGRRGPEDDLELVTDPVLDPSKSAVDVVVGEVKEGKARLNDATRDPEVLRATLARVGCVPPERMPETVQELRRAGHVEVMGGGVPIPARVRLIAFGAGPAGPRSGYRVIDLNDVADFIQRHLERYHGLLHPADLQDPVLSLLHLLRKLE